jgi:putative holliday junction resolvase
MARVLGIDYGTKRTGIATTDPEQIIASGLTTVETPKLKDWLKEYLVAETVETIVVGLPLHEDGNPAQIANIVDSFVAWLKSKFPEITIERMDERYSSRLAKEAILLSGAKKQKRRDKALVDKISASIILNDWMQSNVWSK